MKPDRLKNITHKWAVASGCLLVATLLSWLFLYNVSSCADRTFGTAAPLTYCYSQTNDYDTTITLSTLAVVALLIPTTISAAVVVSLDQISRKKLSATKHKNISRGLAALSLGIGLIMLGVWITRGNPLFVEGPHNVVAGGMAQTLLMLCLGFAVAAFTFRVMAPATKK